MGTTPLNSLPYPEGTEQPFVHLDMAELANAVDAKLYVECLSTARPPHRPGRRIYETNTQLHYMSNGAAWLPLAVRSPAGELELTNDAPGANVWTRWSGAGLDPAVYRVGHEVQAYGLLRPGVSTTYGAAKVIARVTSPVLRPPAEVHRVLPSQSGYVEAIVEPAGNIRLIRFDGYASQNWIDLSGLRWPVEL